MISTLPIAEGFYESSSLPVSAQSCKNWYVNIPQTAGLSEAQLFGTPGITQVVTSGGTSLDANRGGREMNGIPYFVNANALYRLNSDGTLDNLGEITGTGRVSMSDNGIQLCILVPGGDGYIFTEPSTLVEITDSDFRANGDPQHVWYVDGYFVFTTDADNKFILSAINDGTSYNALDFGSAESSPDGTVTPVVYNNQLFIVGQITTEAFTNTGNVNFPFQRSGLFLNQGTNSPFSVVVTPESFMFVGAGKNQTPGVYMYMDNRTQKVSTNAIDELMQDLTQEELAMVYGWTYSQSGHYFVGWSLPHTAIVYDTTTGKWHERGSQYIGFDLVPVDTTYRASCFVQAYGSIYCADVVDGRIGIVSPDVYDEYGNAIIRTRASQPFYNHMQPYSIPYIELTIESGVGSVADSDPEIMMDISRDGGKTWGDIRPRKMGRTGEYTSRVIWRRNGQIRRFAVLRFTLSAPVKPVIISLQADLVGIESAAA